MILTTPRSLLLLIFLFFESIPLFAVESLASDFSANFLNLLNQIRSQETLVPLSLDSQLESLSQEWSIHLAQNQKSFHRSSPSLLDFLKKESWSCLNENLHNSLQGNDPSFVLEHWLHSPIHKKNLLHPKITRMGIACTQGKEGFWYVVWNGGAPLKP